MTYQTPPKGWYTFGTHVDVIVMLRFSEETDEAGIPLWERPVWNYEKEMRAGNEGT